MNIDKAIELKKNYLRSPLCNLTQDERDADKLSIEALELVKDKRGYPEYIIPNLLPGETKD